MTSNTGFNWRHYTYNAQRRHLFCRFRQTNAYPPKILPLRYRDDSATVSYSFRDFDDISQNAGPEAMSARRSDTIRSSIVNHISIDARLRRLLRCDPEETSECALSDSNAHLKGPSAHAILIHGRSLSQRGRLSSRQRSREQACVRENHSSTALQQAPASESVGPGNTNQSSGRHACRGLRLRSIPAFYLKRLARTTAGNRKQDRCRNSQHDHCS